MMDVNFMWKLTDEEKGNLLSKMKSLFTLNSSSTTENQFISKSCTFSDSKKDSQWYLIITSGVDFCIQVELCLANSQILDPLFVTCKLILKTAFVERACYEFEGFFGSEKNCKHSCYDRFFNAFHLMHLLESQYDIIFVCNMQIQAKQVSEKTCIQSEIQSDYEKLLKDTKYSDFMVITSTKKFNVHKNILSARSEFFAAMFEHNMKETKESFVEIKEFDDEVIQEFLRYIYCGKVENLNKLAKNLLSIAEKYLIDGLKVLCLEEFCKNMNIENALELLVLADNHNAEPFRSYLINFIVKNIKNPIIKSNLNVIENVNLSNKILCRTVDRYA